MLCSDTLERHLSGRSIYSGSRFSKVAIHHSSEHMAMFMVAGVWGRDIPIAEDQEAEKSPHKPGMGIHSDLRLPARLPSVSCVSSGMISECETEGDLAVPSDTRLCTAQAKHGSSHAGTRCAVLL